MVSLADLVLDHWNFIYFRLPRLRLPEDSAVGALKCYPGLSRGKPLDAVRVLFPRKGPS